MKKYLALLLALAMLALTACGTAQANTENKNTDAPAENAGQTLPVDTVEAKRLPTQTEASVTEIAFQAGFQSSAYFTKTFRTLQGMTPTAFRQQNKAEKTS